MTDADIRRFAEWVDRISRVTTDPLFSLPTREHGGPIEILSADGNTAATIPGRFTIYEAKSFLSEVWLDRYISRFP